MSCAFEKIPWPNNQRMTILTHPVEVTGSNPVPPTMNIEAPCTKVQGIFHARKMSIDCSSLANPRSKLRGIRSLSMLKG
jgi:hypothetical protein